MCTYDNALYNEIFLFVYYRIIQEWIVAYHLSLTNLKLNFDQTKIKQTNLSALFRTEK